MSLRIRIVCFLIFLFVTTNALSTYGGKLTIHGRCEVGCKPSIMVKSFRYGPADERGLVVSFGQPVAHLKDVADSHEIARNCNFLAWRYIEDKLPHLWEYAQFEYSYSVAVATHSIDPRNHAVVDDQRVIPLTGDVTYCASQTYQLSTEGPVAVFLIRAPRARQRPLYKVRANRVDTSVQTETSRPTNYYLQVYPVTDDEFVQEVVLGSKGAYSMFIVDTRFSDQTTIRVQWECVFSANDIVLPQDFF